jgi:hypothetical protein
MSRYDRSRRALARCTAVLFILGGSGFVTAAEPSPPRAGFVDGSGFAALAGEDAVSVEIHLTGDLLQALARADPELSALVAGLDGLHAVILTLENPSVTEALRARVRETHRTLAERGWQRVGLVQQAGQQIQVLVLNDRETIRGLVVMIVDENESQMVFANVSGILDLARIEALGESMDLPGLSELGSGAAEEQGEEKKDEEK